MRIRAEGRKSGQDREDGDALCDSVTRLGRHAYSGNHKTVPKRRLSHCFAFAAIAKGGMREMRGVFIIGKTLCLRSEEHTSELQSLMRLSYAVFCLKKKFYTRQTSFPLPP